MVNRHAGPHWPRVPFGMPAQGLPVFPLQPRSKLPYKGSHRSRTPPLSRSNHPTLGQSSPQSNIGIATGHLVDVVDIDRTEGVLSWLNSNLPKPDEPIWSEVLGVVWTPRARLARISSSPRVACTCISPLWPARATAPALCPA